MKFELVTVVSTDNLELPALLSLPRGAKEAAIAIHGNGDSGFFYKDTLVNTLAQSLGNNKIGLLALNNRGARYKKKLVIRGSGEPGQEETYLGGVHYELIEDSVMDFDGAIAFLKKRGIEKIYLIGFSTGANKICVYDQKGSHAVDKYVLAGPGDDSGIYYSLLGKQKFNQALKIAEDYKRAGRPLKPLPKYTGTNPFSAQSILDMLHPDGPYNTFPYYEAAQQRLGNKELFKEYKAITVPTYVIFGENDEYTFVGGGTKEVLDMLKSYENDHAKGFAYELLPGADHGFHGYEQEFADKVAAWLKG